MRANEFIIENLRDWFKEKWVRFGPDGKIRGDCARGDDSEGKPKCLPQKKAQALGKKGRASAAARKRREDPNPERSGKAINVNTKKKSNEGVAEGRFDEPLTGWHIVYRKSGNPVHATPSFETKDQAQKYLMTKMFANHQDYKVVHTAGVGVAEASLGTALMWPEIVDQITKAMRAMGWTARRQNDDAFVFSTRGAESEDQWYIVIIENRGHSAFTYALGTIEDGDPYIGEQATLPMTAASVSEVMAAIREGFGLAESQCPHCGGPMFSELLINEKKDACYYKVKSRYKVWPSAYASGALVKCRKKGAKNWGNKS